MVEFEFVGEPLAHALPSIVRARGELGQHQPPLVLALLTASLAEEKALTSSKQRGPSP